MNQYSVSSYRSEGYGALFTTAGPSLCRLYGIMICRALPSPSNATWCCIGLICDVESYVYMALLEEMDCMVQRMCQSRKYASGEELRACAERTHEKWDLGQSAMFRSSVRRMSWVGKNMYYFNRVR